MAINPYEQALDNAKRDKARKQADYEANSDSWHEAILNYFVASIEYSPRTGKLMIRASCKHLFALLKADSINRPVESEVLQALVVSALLAYPVQSVQDAITEADNIIVLPRQQRLGLERECAVCGAETPDGTKELCGACHEQYRLREQFDNRVLSHWMLERIIKAAS